MITRRPEDVVLNRPYRSLRPWISHPLLVGTTACGRVELLRLVEWAIPMEAWHVLLRVPLRSHSHGWHCASTAVLGAALGGHSCCWHVVQILWLIRMTIRHASNRVIPTLMLVMVGRLLRSTETVSAHLMLHGTIRVRLIACCHVFCTNATMDLLRHLGWHLPDELVLPQLFQ